MTGFNMTASVTQGSDFTYFAYDDQHQRVSQVTAVSGNTASTTYFKDPASGAMSEYVVYGPTTATDWNGFSWGGSLWGGTLSNGDPTFVDYITLDGQIIAQRKTQYGQNIWGHVTWGAFQWGNNLTSLTKWNAFTWGASPWYANGLTASLWGDFNWGAANWGGIVSYTTQYFVLDHLGSVAVIMDSSGSVVERQSYDAWGKQRNPLPRAHRFWKLKFAIFTATEVAPFSIAASLSRKPVWNPAFTKRYKWAKPKSQAGRLHKKSGQWTVPI